MATFMVNGQENELKMLVNGVDCSGDFIGNTSHGMDTDEDGRYIASQDDFDWWKSTITAHEKMADVIASYKESNDPDEVDRVVNDWIDVDLDNQPAQVIHGLKQAFGDLQKIISPWRFLMDKVKWSTAMFGWSDGETSHTMYAIIPDDSTGGLIVGEWQSVLDIHAALGRLIESSIPDEVVTELDERLGHKWLSVSQAAEEFSVPVDTVRYAAREGHIPLAKKQGRDWRFPQRKFLWWLAEVYRPKSGG